MAEHIPVLVEEVMAHFAPRAGDTLLDTTVGHGGHAKAFLERTGGRAHVVGLDADAAALEAAKENLAVYQDHVTLLHTNFGSLKDSLEGGGIVQTPPQFTHILFDLGIGSHQLADATRGFSFQSNESLAMQYGDATGVPDSQLSALNYLAQRLGYLPDAADIIEGLSAEDLAQVIYVYGEERYSRRIAAALKRTTMRTATELAQIIRDALPASYERGRIHPATRTFQALRLAANRELEVLAAALPQAVDMLAPGGKLAVISFHSLEDRIVKQFLRQQAGACVCPPQQPVCTCGKRTVLAIVTKKPVRAGEEEVAHNPRARSAKLRVAVKNSS